MARNCLVLSLTLAVALVGVVRLDAAANPGSADHRVAVQNANASLLQHSLLRTQLNRALSQLNSTEVSFAVLKFSTGNEVQAVATSASLVQSSAAVQRMILLGLCVKQQV